MSVLFNTYGPRQSDRAIIPTIISQILNGETKIKLGNLTPTRDLNFVKDTARAFLSIEKVTKLNGEVTNVGLNDEISIGDLAHLICDLMDQDIEIVNDEQRVRPEKSEVERLVCNNTKILHHTDWKPKYNLETGLRETIDWLETHLIY